ncbi:MxcI [Pendulispora albinea]|uniref:MxcI n=1 Tax=Pendulispora albinea TaxID=2741071 RepID=A0ABZ2M6S5_9BACT
MVRSFLRASVLSSLALLGACSSNSGAGDPVSTEPDGTKPLYAFLSLVSTTKSSHSYVNFYDSPDITAVNFNGAREFPGSSGIDAVGGKLFVSSGEAPLIMRFGITEDKKWKDEGNVNFANYGSSAGLWGNGFGSAKGYMTFNNVDRVVWDPATLTIHGRTTASADLVRDRNGLLVRASYDRALIAQGDRLYWPYYWSDGDYYHFDGGSQIAVYDTGTDQIRRLIDAPCPGLDYASKDDEGNLYFSNWVFATAAPVFAAGAPKTCVVKVKAGTDTVDPSFTFNFADVTQGRQAAAFQVIGRGQAFFAVLHDEKIDKASAPDPKSAIYGNVWRFWSFNLVTKEAKPIEGIDTFAGGYRATVVNGRTFLLLPRSDYASSVTYELLPDGTAKRLFESLGWAYQFIRVR